MEYVELLRAKRVMSWYGGILIALVAIGLMLAFKDGPPAVHMSRDTNPHIPFWIVFGATTFASVLLAPFVAVGLNAEFNTIAITWTRPIPRLAIALRYVAVDLGTLLAAWLLTAAVAFAGIFALGLGKYITFGGHESGMYLICLGVAVMWYGLVLLLTTIFPGHGGAIIGGSWAYTFIVPGLSQIPFPPLLHYAVAALNYANPMAYLGSVGSGRRQTLIAGTADQHTIAVWLIGIAAIAVATRIWATREVPS